MEPNDLPLVCLPIGLDDHAAAQVLEFLQAFTAAFERHYFDQIHRHYRADDERGAESRTTGPLSDPPF
jgi:hypothetical protein